MDSSDVIYMRCDEHADQSVVAKITSDSKNGRDGSVLSD